VLPRTYRSRVLITLLTTIILPLRASLSLFTTTNAHTGLACQSDDVFVIFACRQLSGTKQAGPDGDILMTNIRVGFQGGHVCTYTHRLTLAQGLSFPLFCSFFSCFYRVHIVEVLIDNAVFCFSCNGSPTRRPLILLHGLSLRDGTGALYSALFFSIQSNRSLGESVDMGIEGQRCTICDGCERALWH
jgi:hypothetical protein